MTALATASGTRAPAAALLLFGAVEVAGLAALAYWPAPPVPFPGILFYAAAFLAYALGARSLAVTTAAGGASGRGRVWAIALAARVILLPRDPVLSDDVYRYLWDGHVQLQGWNPYGHPPASPTLEPLRTSWHALINHPDVPTIYPPAAQVAFLLIALLGGTILAAKLLWLAFDLATAVLLRRIAAGRATAPLVEYLYLCSPLLIVETAWSAHLEPLGLFALALVLRAARPVAAGAALALAALTKFAPAAALPPLVRSGGLRLAGAFAVTVLLLYAPYLAAGPTLWAGLGTYVRHWRFNDGLFAVMAAVTPSLTVAKAACAVAVLAVIARATLARFSTERSLFWILGAGLLLSPTVHPWYVLWLLPFAALRRSRPWLLLTGLVFLAYWGQAEYQRTGAWPQPLWVRLAIWAPFLALLAADAIADRRRAAARAP